ncbi:hypothetical protein HMPREF9099_02528, partial [Lachnospiraceae bacterium oral taxon 082 str. F0431]
IHLYDDAYNILSGFDKTEKENKVNLLPRPLRSGVFIILPEIPGKQAAL